MHVEDLITVERQLGYRYELPGEERGHYQWVCPRCRRSLLALAQGSLWDAAQGERLGHGGDGDGDLTGGR
jgi:hypothetical protein